MTPTIDTLVRLLDQAHRIIREKDETITALYLRIMEQNAPEPTTSGANDPPRDEAYDDEGMSDWDPTYPKLCALCGAKPDELPGPRVECETPRCAMWSVGDMSRRAWDALQDAIAERIASAGERDEA